MTAEEMFEKLGYERDYSNNGVIYKKNCSQINNITFANDRKDIYMTNGYMDLKLFKAIQQQIKELGWLDD